MAISENEMLALRGWLGILALFEVPEIFGLLVQNKPINGFFSKLKNARIEKRVWAMVLMFLVLARVQAATYPSSEGVMMHCAAVHVLEALAFGYEYLVVQKSNGDPYIFAIIMANAIWFSYVAVRI